MDTYKLTKVLDQLGLSEGQASIRFDNAIIPIENNGSRLFAKFYKFREAYCRELMWLRICAENENDYVPKVLVSLDESPVAGCPLIVMTQIKGDILSNHPRRDTLSNDLLIASLGRLLDDIGRTARNSSGCTRLVEDWASDRINLLEKWGERFDRSEAPDNVRKMMTASVKNQRIIACNAFSKLHEFCSW